MRYFLPQINPTLWMEISGTIFFLMFIGLVIWVYLPSRRSIYIERGELPLNED